MQVLDFAKPLPVRKETVDVPELGGAVVVRGLMASEAFAIQAYRAQAMRRLREEAAERRAQADASGAAAPAADVGVEQLTFDELVLYARYVSHLLAAAVTTASGGPLWSAEQWETCAQHHKGVIPRLQAVAERLSGLDVEDVEKN